MSKPERSTMSLPHRNDVAVAFGAALRVARRAMGLSQKELGSRADFDRTYPSLLERGLRSPSLTCVIAIAQVLKVRPEQLVTNTLTNMSRRRA